MVCTYVRLIKFFCGTRCITVDSAVVVFYDSGWIGRSVDARARVCVCVCVSVSCIEVVHLSFCADIVCNVFGCLQWHWYVEALRIRQRNFDLARGGLMNHDLVTLRA